MKKLKIKKPILKLKRIIREADYICSQEPKMLALGDTGHASEREWNR